MVSVCPSVRSSVDPSMGDTAKRHRSKLCCCWSGGWKMSINSVEHPAAQHSAANACSVVLRYEIQGLTQTCLLLAACAKLCWLLSVCERTSRGLYCWYWSQPESFRGRVGQKYLITMYILCGLVGGITLAAITIYLVRRRNRLHDKLTGWMTSSSTTQHQLPADQYKVGLFSSFTHSCRLSVST